jgi:hypothetical protein
MAGDPKPKHAPEGHFKLDRMKEPPRPRPPWPPPGSRGPHKVSGAQDWAMVANAWGVGDVMDLISWNFGTKTNRDPTPRQVNWYLHHYVGCWRVTADGKNFRFIEADPGWVYIPPIGWSRKGPSLPFHTSLAMSVNRLVPLYRQLSYGFYTVEAMDMYLVQQALHNGLLRAEVNSSTPHAGEYISGSNKFIFPSASIATFDEKMTIAHEATHAAMDRKYSGRGVRRWQNEVMACAAEALWAIAYNPKKAKGLLSRSDATRSTKAAVVLAHYMHANPAPRKTIESYDALIPDFRDMTKTVNPARELMQAVRLDIREIHMDPDTLMPMDGWTK